MKVLKKALEQLKSGKPLLGKDGVNELRYQAYLKEKEAIEKTNKIINTI